MDNNEDRTKDESFNKFLNNLKKLNIDQPKVGDNRSFSSAVEEREQKELLKKSNQAQESYFENTEKIFTEINQTLNDIKKNLSSGKGRSERPKAKVSEEDKTLIEKLKETVAGVKGDIESTSGYVVKTARNIGQGVAKTVDVGKGLLNNPREAVSKGYGTLKDILSTKSDYTVEKARALDKTNINNDKNEENDNFISAQESAADSLKETLEINKQTLDVEKEQLEELKKIREALSPSIPSKQKDKVQGQPDKSFLEKLLEGLGLLDLLDGPDRRRRPGRGRGRGPTGRGPTPGPTGRGPAPGPGRPPLPGPMGQPQLPGPSGQVPPRGIPGPLPPSPVGAAPAAGGSILGNTVRGALGVVAGLGIGALGSKIFGGKPSLPAPGTPPGLPSAGKPPTLPGPKPGAGPVIDVQAKEIGPDGKPVQRPVTPSSTQPSFLQRAGKAFGKLFKGGAGVGIDISEGSEDKKGIEDWAKKQEEKIKQAKADKQSAAQPALPDKIPLDIEPGGKAKEAVTGSREEDGKTYMDAYAKARDSGASVKEAKQLAADAVKSKRDLQAAEKGTTKPTAVPSKRGDSGFNKMSSTPTVVGADGTKRPATNDEVVAAKQSLREVGESDKTYMDAYAKARDSGASVKEAKQIAADAVKSKKDLQVAEKGTTAETAPGVKAKEAITGKRGDSGWDKMSTTPTVVSADGTKRQATNDEVVAAKQSLRQGGESDKTYMDAYAKARDSGASVKEAKQLAQDAVKSKDELQAAEKGITAPAIEPGKTKGTGFGEIGAKAKGFFGDIGDKVRTSLFGTKAEIAARQGDRAIEEVPDATIKSLGLRELSDEKKRDSYIQKAKKDAKYDTLSDEEKANFDKLYSEDLSLDKSKSLLSDMEKMKKDTAESQGKGQGFLGLAKAAQKDPDNVVNKSILGGLESQYTGLEFGDFKDLAKKGISKAGGFIGGKIKGLFGRKEEEAPATPTADVGTLSDKSARLGMMASGETTASGAAGPAMKAFMANELEMQKAYGSTAVPEEQAKPSLGKRIAKGLTNVFGFLSGSKSAQASEGPDWSKAATIDQYNMGPLSAKTAKDTSGKVIGSEMDATIGEGGVNIKQNALGVQTRQGRGMFADTDLVKNEDVLARAREQMGPKLAQDSIENKDLAREASKAGTGGAPIVSNNVSNNNKTVITAPKPTPRNTELDANPLRDYQRRALVY